MTAETEKIEFQTLTFYHFYIRNVADTYFGKVRLSGNRTQTCELRAVETYPVIIFRMLIIKGFQYFRSIILFILGFLPNKESWSFNSVIALINLTSTLNKKRISSFTYHRPASNALFIEVFSGEGFISQPITASITYHHQLLSYVCFLLILLVTVCFIA